MRLKMGDKGNIYPLMVGVQTCITGVTINVLLPKLGIDLPQDPHTLHITKELYILLYRHLCISA